MLSGRRRAGAAGRPAAPATISAESLDADLVSAARAGDEQAIGHLLRRHYSRIYTLCYRMLGERRDAEDAAQDALIAIVRGLDRFDGRAAFGTWAHRVTANVCFDELRRRRRRPTTAEMPDEIAATHGPAPESMAVDRVALEQALIELPEEYRVAVVLRDVADFDYAEIAEWLGVPPGTVRSRIARGRAALAEQLGPGGNPPAPARRPRELT